jgi:Integrase core domain
MRRPRSPFALAVCILAGFLNRSQQDAIDYLREENRVLREMVGRRRLKFTDTQRKRLAIRGKALGRALLRGVATVVEPDTILDSKFTATFRSLLKDAGIRVLVTPASAPNCNAYAERFVRSIKDECLDRMIFFGTASLDRALREYEAHYLEERNHQGVGNELIDPVLGDAEGVVARRERLGGLLNYYFLRAA